MMIMLIMIMMMMMMMMMIHNNVYIYIYVYVYMYVCVYIYIYIYTYIHVQCVYIYIYIYIYIHTHVYGGCRAGGRALRPLAAVVLSERHASFHFIFPSVRQMPKLKYKSAICCGLSCYYCCVSTSSIQTNPQ